LELALILPQHVFLLPEFIVVPSEAYFCDGLFSWVHNHQASASLEHMGRSLFINSHDSLTIWNYFKEGDTMTLLHHGSILHQ
jgi:hypothetical protein